MKNPDAPFTPRQSFGIFKLIRRDVRELFEQKNITRQQASDLMQTAYSSRSQGGSIQEANDAFNIALAAL